MAIAQHNRAFLAGKDEMSALLREHDWSSSALGAPELASETNTMHLGRIVNNMLMKSCDRVRIVAEGATMARIARGVGGPLQGGNAGVPDWKVSRSSWCSGQGC